jgi:hypothetical protein
LPKLAFVQPLAPSTFPDQSCGPCVPDPLQTVKPDLAGGEQILILALLSMKHLPM